MSAVDRNEWLAICRSAGVLDASVPPVAGRLDAAVTLAGSVGTPTAQATARGRGLSAVDVADVAVEATANGTLDRAEVDVHARQSYNFV